VRRISTGARRTPVKSSPPPVAPSSRFCNLFRPEFMRREGLASYPTPPALILYSRNPQITAQDPATSREEEPTSIREEEPTSIREEEPTSSQEEPTPSRENPAALKPDPKDWDQSLQ